MSAVPALVEGTPDEKRTSPVRRTFCLIVLFDLGLSVLVWLIYVQLLGYTPTAEALRKEVLNYTFHTSMFDTAIISSLRFTILEISYGYFSSARPWLIAATTMGTCATMIVKCVLYDFQHRTDKVNGPVAMDYFLLIFAFSIVWVETVFLEYRVIPQERAAKQAKLLMGQFTPEDGLLITTRQLGFLPTRPYSSNVSEAFFTPAARSAMVSDDEDEDESVTTAGARPAPPAVPAEPLSPYLVVMRRRAEQLRESAWRVYHEQGSVAWNREAGDTLDSGIVFTHRNLSGLPGKTFKLEGVVCSDPKLLFHELVDKIEDTPQWNPTVVLVKRLELLPNELDVIHNISSDALGGAIAARDFVLLRTWTQRDGVRYLASTSVEHPNCPPTKQRVRGEYAIGCIAIEPVLDDCNRSRIVWILNTNIKGWVPQRLFDHGMTTVLLEFLGHMCRRMDQLNSTALGDGAGMATGVSPSHHSINGGPHTV